MKPTMTSLLLLVSTLLISTSHAAVLDTDGDILLANVKYYIVPVLRGPGGGLTMSARPTSRCPLFVVQEPLDVSSGLPVNFTPINSKTLLVQESSDLNIQFSAATTCINSNVWRLGSDGSSSTNLYVRTDGVAGSPGASTLNNWFKIVASGSDYKIVFCPGVCSTCRPVCGDVGVFVEGNTRWLGLNRSSFPVMFKKALKNPRSAQLINSWLPPAAIRSLASCFTYVIINKSAARNDWVYLRCRILIINQLNVMLLISVFVY